MSDLIIIGLCGKARSGKDLAASSLSIYRGCHRIALADPIRSALAELGGPAGDILKELTPTFNYRRAMQTLGTESRNQVNAPGLWVHLLLAKIEYLHLRHPCPRDRFVIPDFRFRLEEAMVRHQVARWRGRLGILRLARSGDEIPEAAHASETEVDVVPCHETYQNDGTVDELIAAACGFFDQTKDGR